MNGSKEVLRQLSYLHVGKNKSSRRTAYQRQEAPAEMTMTCDLEPIVL